MRFGVLTLSAAVALAAAGCGGGEDGRINAAVKMRLLSGLQTSALHIHPHTTSGVVTLTGGVMSASDRADALRIARGVSGVREVRDELANRQNF